MEIAGHIEAVRHEGELLAEAAERAGTSGTPAARPGSRAAVIPRP